MRQGLPCVGLVVFLGCFTFLVAPDNNLVPKPFSQGRTVAEALSQKPLPLNALPTVIIDPGHGGIDEGTAWYGLREKDLTLDVAQRLQRLLGELHIPTALTRTSDTYVSLPDRAEFSNRRDNALFVSIHFNQAAEESINGVETFYADQKLPPAQDWTWIGFFNHRDEPALDNGENFAASVQTTLASRMLIPNRGIKSRNLYVVRHTRAPAILVEGGFLSNKLENQSLRNDAYRERLATALATGIASYIQTTHPLIPMQTKLASAEPMGRVVRFDSGE